MQTLQEVERIHPKLQNRARQVLIVVLSSLIILVLTFAIMEGIARIFWKIQYGIPFFQPDKIPYAFYPELTELDWKYPELRGQDHSVDILFLGGSVLNPNWGNIEQDLREQLTSSLKQPIRIYNMAEIGHTSRDSYLKYQLLEGHHFDLVIFYHGINEARTNNIPPELFKSDYSHYSWYETVNTLEKFHNESSWALFYTIKYLTIRLKEQWGIVQYVSIKHGPNEDWLVYGKDIKSAASFETNLRALLELAQKRGETVLLLTFATYLPDDYSSEAFEKQSLDYSLHLSPIELWGSPENVTAAVAHHNEIIRDIASQYDNIHLVDQEKLMPKGHRYFNDICHLTSVGSTKFVENMFDEMLKALND